MKILSLLAVALICASCAGIPIPTDEKHLEKIHVGTTTREEVLALLGVPRLTSEVPSQAGGKITTMQWFYYHTSQNASLFLGTTPVGSQWAIITVGPSNVVSEVTVAAQPR